MFGTIAAESQRLINETYSARPRVHAQPGLSRRRRAPRADGGDHRRPGADGRQHPLHGRHRHRRQCPRIPVQPSRRAHRTSTAFSFNIPTTRERSQRPATPARRRSSATSFTWAGCVRAAKRTGNVTDIDVSSSTTRQIAQRGCHPRAGYKAGGWSVKIFAESGFSIPTSRSGTTPNRSSTTLYRRPRRADMGGST